MNRLKILLLGIICLPLLTISAANKGKTDATSNAHNTIESAPLPTYKVVMYGDFPHIDNEVTPHYLGGKLSASWSQFEEIYLRRNDIAVGMAKSDVDVAKPAIYNAVERINKHFRREISKGSCEAEIALSKLEHILVCAKALYYESNSEAIEEELRRAKSPSQIVSIFERIDVEFR